jgi:hypothetical protein
MGLLQNDSNVNRRLALIAIDNAVELAIKTFLSLPRRVTGLTISRKRLDEVFDSFPALLDTLEEVAADKVKGADLAAVEWYHRLRNQLYHQGYGLSVERDKVEVYAELANVLFKNLFGTPALESRAADAELLGRYIELWARLEAALADIASDNTLTGGRPVTVLQAARFLRSGGLLPIEDFVEIETLRRLRNEMVHGVIDYRTVLNEGLVAKLEALLERYEDKPVVEKKS